MPKKPIYVRIEDEMRKDFDSVLELTGLGETQFVKAAIKALVEYVRQHGEITLPLAIVPKSERSKTAAAPQHAASAPVPALPTPSTRFFVNEEPSETKPAVPHPRSTKPGVAKTVASRKGQP